jgi:hypothetical protein
LLAINGQFQSPFLNSSLRWRNVSSTQRIQDYRKVGGFIAVGVEVWALYLGLGRLPIQGLVRLSGVISFTPMGSHLTRTFAEDLHIKISRSVDVDDGDEMCDGKPIARGHLIAFRSIRTLLIDDSKSDEQCSSGRVAHTCLIFGRHQRKTTERSFHRY